MNAMVRIKKERNYQRLLMNTEFRLLRQISEVNQTKKLCERFRKKMFEQIVRGYYQF